MDRESAKKNKDKTPEEDEQLDHDEVDETLVDDDEDVEHMDDDFWANYDWDEEAEEEEMHRAPAQSC